MDLERMHFLASGIIQGLKKSLSNLSFWQQGQPFINPNVVNYFQLMPDPSH